MVARNRSRRDGTGVPASAAAALMGEDISHAELLARVGGQDPAALGELYDRFAPHVFGLLIHMLASREEAEVLLQEVFTQLWSEGGSLGAEGGSIAAWLIVTARDAALERLRTRRRSGPHPKTPRDGAPVEKATDRISRKTRQRRSAPISREAASRISDAQIADSKPVPVEVATAVRILNSWLPRPGEIALIDDRLNLLHKVIHQLPESQQRALELAVFKGLTEAEIAAELGEPLGKVRTGLRAAVTFVKHRRMAILGKWAANI
jgi:RNA polymerase sigma-70 factor (ECF subfamily)